MAYTGQDELFMQYINKLETVLARHGENSSEFQADQVNTLSKLELEFRKVLVRHSRGLDVYRAFIDRCRNILTARPFFRERDTTFKTQISAALKAKDPIALTRFHINTQFIKFVMGLGGWNDEEGGKDLVKLASDIMKLRDALVECNLPLAISQARTFFGRNLQSHLDYMDCTQIAAVGLVEAVDKFVGPYKRNFRAVCIGRMLGNLIEDNSQTFVHFYPSERKGLYRIRKLLRKLPADGPIDYDTVHQQLNDMETSVSDKLTAKNDMLHILTASQTVSASALPHDGDEDDHTGLIERYPDEISSQPDMLLEAAETRHTVSSAIVSLSVFDQKLLKMRGVDFG